MNRDLDLSKFESHKVEPDGLTKKLFGMPVKTPFTEDQFLEYQPMYAYYREICIKKGMMNYKNLLSNYLIMLVTVMINSQINFIITHVLAVFVQILNAIAYMHIFMKIFYIVLSAGRN